MWERWDGWTPEKGFNDAGMNSYNHYAYGAVGQWIYATVAGIELDPERPGYKHILIRPQPGGGLTHARARLHSMYGLIESAWRIEDRTLRLDVTIPPNTTATVRLPTNDAGSVEESATPAARAAGVQVLGWHDGVALLEIAAGRYRFTASLTSASYAAAAAIPPAPPAR
jgi:alpha-L-rhamnosidase